MGEGPDGDLVDAGLGDGADVLERDPARGLEPGTSAGQCNSRAEVGEVKLAIREDGLKTIRKT